MHGLTEFKKKSSKNLISFLVNLDRRLICLISVKEEPKKMRLPEMLAKYDRKLVITMLKEHERALFIHVCDMRKTKVICSACHHGILNDL